MRPRTAVALVVAPGDRELLKLLEQIELFVNAESDDSASWRKPPEESRPGQAAWTARRERVKRRPAGGQRSLCPTGANSGTVRVDPLLHTRGNIPPRTSRSE